MHIDKPQCLATPYQRSPDIERGRDLRPCITCLGHRFAVAEKPFEAAVAGTAVSSAAVTLPGSLGVCVQSLSPLVTSALVADPVESVWNSVCLRYVSLCHLFGSGLASGLNHLV